MIFDIKASLTSGEISKRLGEPLHRVNHVLATRGIEPVGRAGIVRVYDERAFEAVKVALAEMKVKRDARVEVA